MWRSVCIIFFGLFMMGCASQAPKPPRAAHQPLPVLAVYREAPSAALVFDPPVISDQPPLDLSRDDRTPGAFVGYEETIATFYYVRTDDRQFDGSGLNQDRFERRAISTKVGVSYR
jgi:hypothetical protein